MSAAQYAVSFRAADEPHYFTPRLNILEADELRQRLVWLEEKGLITGLDMEPVFIEGEAVPIHALLDTIDPPRRVVTPDEADYQRRMAEQPRWIVNSNGKFFYAQDRLLGYCTVPTTYAKAKAEAHRRNIEDKKGD